MGHSLPGPTFYLALMAEVKFEALSRPQKLRDSAEKIVSNLLLGIPANTIIAFLAYPVFDRRKKFENSSTSKKYFSAVLARSLNKTKIPYPL